ncbi:MAG TPA: phosphate ABC transporter substrate-binding protein [Terriglobales bacterium]|nr:phosphate ABC transporter substrate-binding protein [Terriglobales bacterium]
MINGTRRLGGLALAAMMFAAACSSAGASPTPTPTDAPTPTPTVAAASPAAATPAASAPAAAPTVNCVTGSITAAGSTALQPLVDAAAKQYVKACTGSTITVNGGGSGTGLTQVAGGSIDIGDSDVTAQSKLATPQPADSLVDHIVARQGWIVVTNKDVTGITNLTTQQNVDVWTGKDTNWNQVGGPDLPIVLIFRPSSSGTRSTFKKLVLGNATEANGGQTLTEDSNGAVTTAITKTDGSVSVIGFAYYNDPANKPLLNGLQLDGVDATVANVSNASYKLAADGHMYTKGAATGLTAAFLDYMLGADVQGTLIPSLSYGPVAK